MNCQNIKYTDYIAKFLLGKNFSKFANCNQIKQIQKIMAVTVSKQTASTNMPIQLSSNSRPRLSHVLKVMSYTMLLFLTDKVKNKHQYYTIKKKKSLLVLKC